MQTADDFWSGFATDPRDSDGGSLLASDADRDRVNDLLREALSDGRLTLGEYDERSTSALGARTLGELPGLVADLLPPRRPGTPGLIAATPTDLELRAVAAFQRGRREAVSSFLIPSMVCLVIWAVVMPGGFFWPAFVMLATGVNLVQTLVRREDIIAKHRAKLERKQAKELGRAASEDPEDDSQS
ncbi:DUF1707 SHOCT-like domain-containing protein [Nocardioides limicola]|uniref:DUF1707 SHOCT-like domain-containing protein n=1 Tax=Nocardioides limicola TaxID=2803368 RepID=UPI0027DD6365|nr:DUF1707 domain-containing protein [Nocardioides sp. DJM-14]